MKKPGFLQPLKRMPWRLKIDKIEKEQMEIQKHQFTVIRLEDTKLLEDLQEYRIDYRGKLETNFFKNFF